MKILHLSIMLIVAINLCSSFPLVFAKGIDTMGGPTRLPNVLLTQILSSENNVYLLWENGGKFFFQKSADGGSTFGSPVMVTNITGARSVEPQMAASGNDVYVAWNYFDQNRTYLDFRQSTDNGTSFGDIATLYRGSSLDFLSLNLVTSGKHVYIAWQENSGYAHLIKSDNSGTTFLPIIDLDNNTKGLGDPKIFASNNHVYLFMEGGCIISSGTQQICYPSPFVRRSDDYGNTWSGINPIMNGTAAGFATDARATVSGNNVYLIWQFNGYGFGKILFAKSNDSAATFGKTVYFDNNGQEGYPNVLTNGNNVYLFWQTDGNNTKDIMFAHSVDEGTIFSKPVNISDNKFSSDNYYLYKQIASSGNHIYVTWEQHNQSNSEIFFKMSSDDGETFGNTINLSEDLDSVVKNEVNSTWVNFDKPQVVTSRNNAYVGWINNYEGNNNIFFRTSNDGGNTFENPIIMREDHVIPEFPFAIPILLVSFVSVMVFYRIRFRK
ncbi:Putative sialidase [Nitrosotalea devaniterrae]|uniref:Sialidase n=1 Tax=Nitrosotalea devaniterrae TaxID=1078905 RepID=A0A128A1Y1_9ARCH|nr:Putative sialidase [Candidatus Nitrosotalea devanaterra]